MTEEVNEIVSQVAQELSLPSHKVSAVDELLTAGNTVPFIARYRKEATGNLDEVQIRDIQASTKKLKELLARKETVERAVREQGAWTKSLAKQIKAATTMQAVEDLYLPYKQKRRTKATLAKEAGLMPLAQLVQRFPSDEELEQVAKNYVKP